METSAELVATCPPAVLWEHVAELDAYPAWMQLVHAAERLEDDDGRPAWSVELRTQLGPLARSKRLRMVRTVTVVERTVVFERREVDGRSHSAWVLRGDLEPLDGATRLAMHLTYAGSLWTGGVLQRVLDDQIQRGSENLLALVSGRTR